MELTTYLFNQCLCSTADGAHRKATEEKCGHGTDEDTNQNNRIHQIDLEIIHEIYHRSLGCIQCMAICHLHYILADTYHANFDFFDIRSKQCQCGESSGTDSKSLACGCRCIAKCIESVGALTDFFAKFAHFCVTTSIVGDRTVSIR